MVAVAQRREARERGAEHSVSKASVAAKNALSSTPGGAPAPHAVLLQGRSPPTRS